MGVSNISFGLPARDAVNSAFFVLAMQAGLSSAIINPQSEAMMNAYYAFGALSGLDEGCKEYVAMFAGAAQTKQQPVRCSPGKAAAGADCGIYIVRSHC